MSATIEEVRVLTGYDREIISGPEMVSLESRARKELTAEVGSDLDFTDATADTALFWLLCLFTKIHTGEIATSNFKVGELESRPLDAETNLWLRNYQERRDQLVGSHGGFFGHVAPQRQDREYGSESDE